MKRVCIVLPLILLFLAGCASDNVPVDNHVNQIPHAFIDSIVPVESETGEKVQFEGHGTDSDGKVVSYRWSSSLDGLLSDDYVFSTSLLSAGEHTIYFEVQDDGGLWSDKVSWSIDVLQKDVSLPVIEFFVATPDRIGLKSSAMLSWYTSGSTVVSIDNGIGIVDSGGKITVSPALSTQYQLSAKNEDGEVSATVDVVVVPKAEMGLPVISGFAADPGSIPAGGSAILKWEVLNAEAVTIDPGIGNVEPVGSITIQPEETTSYVILAGNAIGLVLTTTQVLVSQNHVRGKPDLLIGNIEKVETAGGIKIAYTIVNQGTGDAPVSTTGLYANGLHMVDDSPGIIPAGETVTRVVDGWMYNPLTRIVNIVANVNHNVIESDEGNNEMQMPFSVKLIYDFVENAPRAQWGSGYPYEPLVFGGELSDENGFAVFRSDKKLEGGTGPDTYLETHPRWTAGGWIIGDYDIGLKIEPGDHFYGVVGFLDGASTGNVRFWVYIREQGGFEWDVLVPGVSDSYDYKLQTFSVAVPPAYYGKNVDFSLRVDAFRSPLQDWAVWVKARIIR
jgi:hypothetical protein